MAQHHYSYQSDFAKKYFEQGVEQGVEQARGTLRALLEQRFGELSVDVIGKLEHADSDTIARWSPADVLAD